MRTSPSPIRAIVIGMFGSMRTVASSLKAVFEIAVAPSVQAQAFTIDTSSASPLTGLWWNANESGWGATITQQSSILYVTIFVYDTASNPVWYTVSCSDGRRGTWQSTNTLVTAKAMSLEFDVQLDTTESCRIAATLGGSRP